DRADLGEIRRHTRAAAVHAMAPRALAFAVVDRLTAGCRTARDRDAPARRERVRRIAGGRRHAAQPRDDRSRLRLRETAGRHRRAGDAALNDPDEVDVARRAAKLTALQLDARHHVAVRAVAAGAARLIEASAVLDVGLRVTVLLRRSDRGGEDD